MASGWARCSRRAGLLVLLHWACLLCTVSAVYQCPVREVRVKPLDPSQPNSGAGLQADDVRRHIEEKMVWVDPQRHWWSCVDGRAEEPGLTTPAGDAGEFILGLAAFENRLVEVMPRAGRLEEEEVRELLDSFMMRIPYSRRFYMHTDMHAIERLREALDDEEFDPANKPPREDQEKLINMLLLPQYIGCGHIRLLLQHPEQYKVRPELTQWFLKAFFDFMWNHEHGGKLHHHTTKYVELEGEHREGAVVVIDTDKSKLVPGDTCMDLAPMIPGLDDLNSFFTDHATFVTMSIRADVALFFAQRLAEMTIPLSDAPFVITPGSHLHSDMHYRQILGKMTELADIQLGLTVGYLAKGEPQYVARISIERERKTASIIGSAISIVFLMVGLTAMVVVGMTRHRREEEAHDRSLRYSAV